MLFDTLCQTPLPPTHCLSMVVVYNVFQNVVCSPQKYCWPIERFGYVKITTVHNESLLNSMC